MTRPGGVHVAVGIMRNKIEALENLVRTLAKMWEDDGCVLILLDDEFHFRQVGVDVEHHAELVYLLHQHLKFLDRVRVGNSVVAELTHPDKAQLFAAVFNLAQGLVNEQRIHHAGSHKAPAVSLDVAGDFAVAFDEFRRTLGKLAAHGIDDAPLDTGAVEIADKILKAFGYGIPLPHGAIFAGA